jgi:hypothetical protein
MHSDETISLFNGSFDSYIDTITCSGSTNYNPNTSHYNGLANKKDIIAGKFDISINNLQTKSERSKRIPTIGFKGYLGANQFANTFNPITANTWFGLSYVGLDIKAPILFGENPTNTICNKKTKHSSTPRICLPQNLK